MLHTLEPGDVVHDPNAAATATIMYPVDSFVVTTAPVSEIQFFRIVRLFFIFYYFLFN